MNRSSIVKKSVVPIIVIVSQEGESVIRILQTGWKDRFSVIYEDAIDSQECGHKFMTSKEIEKEYDLNVERYLL